MQAPTTPDHRGSAPRGGSRYGSNLGRATVVPKADGGRTLTKKQLDDKIQLDQELFIDIIKEYNRDAEEYNLHAFSWIQDFQDASSFVQYGEENWPKAKKKFGDLMKEYEYMFNSKTQSGFHGWGCGGGHGTKKKNDACKIILLHTLEGLPP